MAERRQIIINKFLNGESAGGIFKALKTGGVKRDYIYRTIKRYRETSSVEDRKRSGRPRSVRTKIWDEIPMDYVRAACDGFEKRLKLVKEQRGGIIPKNLL